MTLENIKSKIAKYNSNSQTITAAYWLLKKFDFKTKNLKGFLFRDDAKPDFILMTTEGDFGEPQYIRIPKNTFQFPLELMLSLLAHELVHVKQKTEKPYILDKNEREFQAYYEMIFHEIFPQTPDISNFHKTFFINKAFEYFNRMGENSVLQQKYLLQKNKLQTIHDALKAD